MSRSAWRCRESGAVLGWVHGGSKGFNPAPGVTIVWHGVSGTAVCPNSVCGTVRVFGGYMMVLKAVS
jgi:hypothetical protein